MTSVIDASDALVAFQGDFTFDSSVVAFQNLPVSGAGLTANNWNVSGNVLPGGGPIRTLRVSAFSSAFIPLEGSGTLFNLNMIRVSGTPNASTSLTWETSPNDFYFINYDLESRIPSTTPPGSITIVAPGTITVAGAISYCSNSVPGPVSDVTVTLSGSGSASTLSDGAGNYHLSSLASGGSYTVTLAKSVAPGAAGINTIDVMAVQRHFLGIHLIPPDCRLMAADVNGDGGVDTLDALAIQRFLLAQTTGTANVGKYQFTPAFRSYSGIDGDQINQNYDTSILGDVAFPFVE